MSVIAMSMNGLASIAAFGARLWRDRRANTMMIVGLGAPLLFGTAGFATDYAYSVYLKQSLDKACDTAVLAATAQSAAAAGNGYNDLNWLKSYGLDIFQGNISKLAVTVTPTLAVVPNGTGGVTATASYSYAMPTYFSRILGIPTINIAGTASATANPTTYINYYILLDISQSMGIGATTSDMSALFTRSSSYNHVGCVFGCHVPQNGQSYANEYLAHSISPRINLRIDAAVSAIQTIIADAQSAAGTQQNIKIGVYTMSDNPVSGTRFTTVSSPSSNYTGLSSTVSGITLGNNTGAGIGDTSFDYGIGQFSNAIPVNGTGVSALSAKNYVFIISDAVRDVAGSCTSGHCTSAFDSSLCAPLKLKATVGTIYTTYLPLYNNNNAGQGYDTNYAALVLPFASQLAPAMQSCASTTDYYYEASDGPALDAAMRALFASTLKSARLTQ